MGDITVAIIEDDVAISEIQSRFVSKVGGFTVVGVANSIAEAGDLLEVLKPDLVLLDVYFPDGNGIDLLWRIRKHHRQTDVILITAAKEINTLQDAIRGGVFDFIVKPIGFPRFEDSLQRFREHKEALKKPRALEQRVVDKIMHPIHSDPPSDAPLPKGIDRLTLGNVHSHIESMEFSSVSADKLGNMLGISRTTARRYLEFLVSRGVLKPTVTYGSVGRPERLYIRVGAGA